MVSREQTPVPPRYARGKNLLAARGRSLVLAGTAMFGIIFVAMWGPVYLFGDRGHLFAYPLFVAALLIVGVLAISAIVFGALSINQIGRTHTAVRSRPSGLWGVLGGALLLVISLPVLWFGGLPLGP